jgi:AbrB family looped-hinge helix DNA binding protein
MAIVTVKSKYQVVIPQAIREKLGISCGDVLEAKVERGRLTYTPKTVIDRIPVGTKERKRFFEKLSEEAPGWLKETWTASERRGTDKLTVRQIDAEVAAVRRQRSRKSKDSRPAR